MNPSLHFGLAGAFLLSGVVLAIVISFVLSGVGDALTPTRDYRVIAEFACKDESAGARLELSCGATTLPHTVAGTGGWQSYREFELGTLHLERGATPVVLRAKSKPGEAVVNVRALRLVPR